MIDGGVPSFSDLGLLMVQIPLKKLRAHTSGQLLGDAVLTKTWMITRLSRPSNFVSKVGLLADSS